IENLAQCQKPHRLPTFLALFFLRIIGHWHISGTHWPFLTLVAGCEIFHCSNCIVKKIVKQYILDNA
ncbi:hypothetical protein ACR2U3_27780, partial [Klebsiella pneumoniae]